jgi:hypothetical protein
MFRLNTKDLRANLAIAALFSSDRSPTEHHLHCKLKSVEGGISLQCSSVAGVCRTKAAAIERGEAFTTFVPVRKLTDVLSNIQDEDVKLGMDGNGLCIASSIGKVKIASSSFVFEPKDDIQEELKPIDAKASQEELAFLCSVSSGKDHDYDCIKYINGYSTIFVGARAAWVSKSALSWLGESTVSATEAKLMSSLLKNLTGSVLAVQDNGNVAIKWDAGVAYIRGVEAKAKRTFVHEKALKMVWQAACEVDRNKFKSLMSMCRTVALPEKLGVVIGAKVGARAADVPFEDNSGTVFVKQKTVIGSNDLEIPTTHYSDTDWCLDYELIQRALSSFDGDKLMLSYDKDAEKEESPLVISEGNKVLVISQLDRSVAL